MLKKNIIVLTDYGYLNGPLFNFFTSNRVSRLFWFGSAKGGIEKMRSIFFQRSKNSGVPVTQPAGCGGESSEMKKVNLFRKVISKGSEPFYNDK